MINLVSCSKRVTNYSDDQVFRYNEHSNIASLDPAFAKDLSDIWAVNQLFNGLVQLDNKLNVKPDLAKSWSISDDGLKYTFTLKENGYFHKHQVFGNDSLRRVSAKDFEYSFNRLLDPATASPGKWTLQNVSDFRALNDSIFEINLKKAFPPFLGLLSMKYCSVVPHEAVTHYGSNFRENPIGTGPFQFKLWIENTKLVLRKNNHYHERDKEGVKLPYIEAVAITFLPDKQSEFLQFVQGNIDFLNSVDPSYKDDLLTPEGELQMRYRATINMVSNPYLNTEYLGFFVGNESDNEHSILLRKAVNYGFDRQKMIKYLRNGIGTPALNGFLPKGLPGFSALEGYSFQPERSRSLLKQYSEITGISTPELTISTNSQYVDLCEFIQRELQNIGIKIHIDVIPPSTLRQAKANGKLPLFRASWVADYPDAENYLSLFYSKNFAPEGPNYTHFANAQFDAWYEASITTNNTVTRMNLYRKMDSLIIAESPVVPLYYDQAVRFTGKGLLGLGSNPINLLTLKYVKKATD
jgi:peptide/nickel transport system substrate-binding protein